MTRKYILFIGSLMSLLFTQCKKDDNKESGSPAGPVPVVLTLDAYNVLHSSAKSGGQVVDDKGSTVTARGVCWSTGLRPTIANSHTNNGTGAGNFLSDISGLQPLTTYYVRAYATNSNGTGYGSAVALTTKSTYQIGDEGPGGGLIFYDKGNHNDGWRYMEVIADDGTGRTYGCAGMTTGATGTAIGTGKTNTATILASCPEFNIGAKYCDDYSNNGFTDWFLPSRDELNLIYTNLVQQGHGSGSLVGYFLSSSEISSQAGYAQSMDNGTQSNLLKLGSAHCCPVRQF